MIFNDENKNENSEQETLEQQEKCERELQESRSRLLSLAAEFDNYKKRIERERVHWIADGQADVLKDILEVRDDVERALNEINRENLPIELLAHLEGVKLIAKSLDKLIEKYNIKEIESINFDPELHEALMQVDSDKHESGQIVSVLQKGYMHKDKLLRASKVSVAR